MKKMNFNIALRVLVLGVLVVVVGLSSPSLYAESFLNEAPQGTVNITVVDENGTVVPSAPIYIFGEHKTHFVGGKEIPGNATFAMKPGHYRISSALTRKVGDSVDRFASYEAHIQVIPGENVAVILPLKQIEDMFARVFYPIAENLEVNPQVAKGF